MDRLLDIFIGGGAGRRAEEERQRMEEERKRHEATLERKEALMREEVASLQQREDRIRMEQRMEREEAAAREQKLREDRERNNALHAEQYKLISEDNKNRLEKLAESNEETLRNERIRESDEKQRLVQRNVDESIRVEQRQKEIEANLGEIAKDAEGEKRKLNELKIGEGQQYSRQLDEVKSKQSEELKAIKEEQNQAVLKGSENAILYQTREAVLLGIEAQGKTKLMTALDNASKARDSKMRFQTIRSESGTLSSNATKLTSKVNTAVRNGAPNRFVIKIIMDLIQKCRMSMDFISQGLNSPVFEIKDELEKDRKIMVKKATETLDNLRIITGDWNSQLLDGSSAEDAIDAIRRNCENFGKLVKTLDEQIREIPQPQTNHKDFNAIVAENCAALTNGNLLDGVRQQELQPGCSTSQPSIEN